MRAFFEWLKRRDLSGFDSRKYPSSKLREAMIQSSEKPEVTFVRHFLESQTSEMHEKKTAIVSYTTMYKAYESYMSEHGFSFRLNNNQFKAYLTMVDGIDDKARSATTRGYRVTSWKQAALAVGLITDDAENDTADDTNVTNDK
jgi:phage/plasmid-associated DNA primase